MGLFARNAAWLKNYFTPSVTPGFVQPVALSEDVQLVHPYTSGWGEQLPLNYFFTDSILNPGQNNNLFCVSPPASVVPGDPENEVVWRIILANISIPAGPTGNFTYRLWIGDNGTAGLRTVDYDLTETITAGITDRTMLAPTNFLDTPWQMIVTRSGLRTTGIGLRQITGQAQGSEGILIEAWILRSPRGGSIGNV